MKRMILICLLLAALLTGCGIPPEDSAETAAETVAAEPSAPPVGSYVPDSAMEQQTAGAVTVFAPDIAGCYDMAVMGDAILLFSEQGSGTRLTLLMESELFADAQLVLDCRVEADAATTRITEEGIAFFDENARKLVILDETLREISRIAVPEDITGGPVLSKDRMQMYYSIGQMLYVLDLETEIPRLLRQHSEDLIPQSLLMEDSLLQCQDQNGSVLVFSTENGQQVKQIPGAMEIVTANDRYLAAFPQEESVVFGTGTEAAQMLQLPSGSQTAMLPESNCVVSMGESGEIACYDVSTGLCSSALKLETAVTAVADGRNGVVWLLDVQGMVYRWDTYALPSGDRTIYAGTYYTRGNPDLTGIERCRERAQEIGQRHGVEIRIWKDALASLPRNYGATEEYSVSILEEQLTLLDQRLGNFPEGFLTQLSETGSGLTICLVRQLECDTGASSLDDGSGLQYWVENHAYIALSTIAANEGTLYHELCHVLDTRVIGESNAYDQWEELNPSGFAYDYDYAANAMRNAGEYLRDAERCFIDTYSMSFPKEDRARVLEYAMTEGNEHYFQSQVMQAKLKQICLGLREAFGLKKSPETFLWEQYLKESLAYSK